MVKPGSESKQTSSNTCSVSLLSLPFRVVTYIETPRYPFQGFVQYTLEQELVRTCVHFPMVYSQGVIHTRTHLYIFYRPCLPTRAFRPDLISKFPTVHCDKSEIGQKEFNELFSTRAMGRVCVLKLLLLSFLWGGGIGA